MGVVGSFIHVMQGIRQERLAQDMKWGEQNHPDGSGGEEAKYLADLLRKHCDDTHHAGKGTWVSILAEEIGEAFAEADVDKLRVELIQVAAVAVNWIEAIDRRGYAPR